MKKVSVALLACGLLTVVFVNSCSSSKKPSENKAEYSQLGIYVIHTKFGDMKVKLYDETPLHSHNFAKLVDESFFDSTLFHRVIKGFMIQGGDPDSKTARPGQQLGMGNLGYKVPPEFNTKFIHKKGALAAARQGDRANPKRESSASQFYIVHGQKVTPNMLTSMENRKNAAAKRNFGTTYLNKPENVALKMRVNTAQKNNNRDSLVYFQRLLQNLSDSLFQPFKYTNEQIQLYDSLGGTPSLDNDYTVFGEVIEGLDIIDSIAAQKTDRGNRPVEDVRMTIKKL